MKRKTVFKSVAVILTIAIMCGLLFLLASCNKHKTKTLEDIFKTEESARELTGYQEELTIPQGWQLYINSSTSEKDASDSGYVPSLDAFIIQHSSTYTLSLIKCNDDRVYFEGGVKGMVFPLSCAITSMRIKDGYIACKFNDGKAGVFDTSGATVVNRNKISKASSASDGIDTVLRIVGGMIAVNGNYDVNGKSGYTSVYRPTYDGSVSNRGELVCRIKNDNNALKNLSGFDGKYISVVGNTAGSYMYRIPDHRGDELDLLPTSKGTVSTNGKDDYYSEITYIGGGRFFIHEDWTVAQTDEYDYYDGFDYYCFTRHIYTPDNDKLSDYTSNSNKIFIYMTNNYYDAEKAGINTSIYLNDGYIYASYALTIIDRVGYYDQFILDQNLNIVMSLSGNYGVTIKDQKKEKVGHYDLIMSCVDGYYYCPIMPSAINIYDKNGNRVGGNDRAKVAMQELSNNVIVAAITDSKDNVLYGAYDIYGNEIIEFKYTKLAAFRGQYTIGERKNENGDNALYLVGIDGKEVALDSDMAVLFSDMATTKAGASIYKIGCYMFKKENGKDADNKTKYLYGVKNLDPNTDRNIIIPAQMESGSVLYAPTTSPRDVFVLEKQTGADGQAQYVVYRLI